MNCYAVHMLPSALPTGPRPPQGGKYLVHRHVNIPKAPRPPQDGNDITKAMS